MSLKVMKKQMIRSSVVALALAATVAAQQPPAQPPPATPAQPPPATPATPDPASQIPPVTFKVEVNYVEVDAVVTDKQGNFVRNLGRDDFQVFEDGKPQSVTTFALIDIPIERAEQPLFAKTIIEPDVRTNARDFDGRLYMIVLDDLHTNVARSPRVKAAARDFITRYMGANDVAAIVTTSGRSNQTQEFTGSKRLLIAAVDKFMGDKLRSSTLERIDEYNRTRDFRTAGDPVTDPAEMERSFKASRTLEALRNVSDYLAGIRGRRKALVFISEGIDYDIHDVFNNRNASTVIDDTREAIAAATRANVSIYSVDPRGLTSLGDEAIEIAGLPGDTSLNLGTQSLQNELRLAQDSLRVLSDETGGFAAVSSNDFAKAFERITQENSSYYVLGYYPANDRRDGRFRKIEVRLTRQGLQVRARKGYVAPRGRASTRPNNAVPGASPALNEAFASPLQVAGLTLNAFAAPFKGTAPNATVVLVLEAAAGGFKFTEQDGKYLDTVDLAVMAVDSEGKVRGGDRSSAQMALRPETYTRIGEGGFRVISKLDLPPGRYQIKFAAREQGAGKLGSVFYDVDVPDYSKAKMAMSGLVVTSTGAGRASTIQTPALEQIKSIVPLIPSAVREFGASEEMGIYAEIYDNLGATPHKVDIAAVIVTEDGREVFSTRDQRDSTEFGGARGGFGYTTRVPLKDLAPGSYVLRLQATPTLANTPGVMREVVFSVRK
jgi:VWFA-related protein